MLITELSARMALALTMWGEARGESISGILGVGEVVCNRAKDLKRRWPRWERDVCLQPRQFSCWNEGDPGRAKLEALVASLSNANQSSLIVAVGAPIMVLADLALSRTTQETKGANHYFAHGIPLPIWAAGVEPVAIIGKHWFYKL